MAPVGKVTVRVTEGAGSGPELPNTTVKLPVCTPLMKLLGVGAVKVVYTSAVPCTVKVVTALLPLAGLPLTFTKPVVAPVGAVTVNDFPFEETAPRVAGTPLKVTDLTRSRFLPEMVTVVPTSPVVGEKLLKVWAHTELLLIKTNSPSKRPNRRKNILTRKRCK